MKEEGPLVQVSGGYLERVSVPKYLRGCTSGKTLTMKAIADTQKKIKKFSEGSKLNSEGRARKKDRKAKGYKNLKSFKPSISLAPQSFISL